MRRRDFLKGATGLAALPLAGCASLGSAVDRELVIGQLAAAQAIRIEALLWDWRAPGRAPAEADRVIDGELWRLLQADEAVSSVVLIGILSAEQAAYLNESEWKKRNEAKTATAGCPVVRGEISELLRRLEGRD